MNIAIIGLGRVGAQFLNQITTYKKNGVNILAVAELGDTEGKTMAKEMGLELKTSEEIAAMGESLDIIFELTGNSEVRKAMRNALKEANNTHTAIAPENFAYLIWSIIENKPLPDVHSNKGY